GMITIKTGLINRVSLPIAFQNIVSEVNRQMPVAFIFETHGGDKPPAVHVTKNHSVGGVDILDGPAYQLPACRKFGASMNLDRSLFADFRNKIKASIM